MACVRTEAGAGNPGGGAGLIQPGEGALQIRAGGHGLALQGI